ncbi:MAG: AMP-binding protein [Burkholderiales bacterium]|nr:AMP-binding protein [Phycisphaerae bacterium]
MLLHPLLRNAQENPSSVAIIDDTGSYTNEKLVQTAMAIGALIRAKTQKGTVGLLLPASAGFVASFYGALMVDKVPVPINFLLGPREVGHIIADSGIDTIITIPLLGARLKDLPVNIIDLEELAKTPPPPGATNYSPAEHQGSDVGTILYTSGTSGLPKGVILTHSNMHEDVTASIQHAQLNQEHRFLGIVPLFHSTGMLVTLLAPTTLGARVIFCGRFSPVGTIQKIREHQITVMAGVPSMYGALCRLKDASSRDMDQMYAALSGGEPLPSKIREAFAARFGKPLLEGYGLTETIAPVAFNTPQNYRPGSVGRAIPGVEIRIESDTGQPLGRNQTGEVLIRGPMVFKGYLNLPDETAAAITPERFFRSGDLGHVDDDGYIFITGRKKDVIIISGEKVYPREIEELLGQHPDVAEAAVVGRRDESRGEAVVAFIVPKESQSVTEESIRAFCREQGMVNWKIPKDIFITNDLPRSPTGKVLKRELAAKLG